MPRLSRAGIFEVILTAVGKLPWYWAVSIFLLLWLGWSVEIYSDPERVAHVEAIYRFFYLGILIAVAFGAFVSVALTIKRRFLLGALNAGRINTHKDLSWRDFERLCHAWLESSGYAVAANLDAGPDGGVDLRANKGGEKYVVQCKLWKSKVGVQALRELYGVQRAESYDGAI
jgi:restriction system protein